MYRLVLLPPALLALLLFTASPGTARAQAAHEDAATAHPESAAEVHATQGHDAHATPYPHHWIGIFGGAATERGREEHGAEGGEGGSEESTHTAGAVGIEYYVAFGPHFGAGVLVEHLGERIDRNYTVLVPLGYHPSHRWRFVVAPGMEFTENHEEWALRLGANHVIPFGSRWELSPEFDVDFIEGGKVTYIYGVLLGFRL